MLKECLFFAFSSLTTFSTINPNPNCY
jgi:hypothetical protein